MSQEGSIPSSSAQGVRHPGGEEHKTQTSSGSGTADPIPAAASGTHVMEDGEPVRNMSSPPATPNTHWHIYGTLGIALLTLLLTSFFNYQAYRGLREELRLQLEAAQLTQPVDFTVESSTTEDGKLIFRIVNSGRADLKDIRAEFNYFFIAQDGGARSRLGLISFLKGDQNSLEAVRRAGLLSEPSDVESLLGSSRSFAMSYLPIGEAFRPEISQASILNATRLSYVLDMQPVMRWRFSYKHGVSSTSASSELFLYVRASEGKSIFEVVPKEVQDLLMVTGGKRVATNIQELEATSLEAFFLSQQSMQPYRGESPTGS